MSQGGSKYACLSVSSLPPGEDDEKLTCLPPGRVASDPAARDHQEEEASLSTRRTENKDKQRQSHRPSVRKGLKHSNRGVSVVEPSALWWCLLCSMKTKHLYHQNDERTFTSQCKNIFSQTTKQQIIICCFVLFHKVSNCYFQI